MLVRFIVENVYSFGKRREFNMFPAARLKKLKDHKYKINDIELVKMAAIYGANASGKSNLVKAIKLLKDIVLDKIDANEISRNAFKLHKDPKSKSQILAIEFIVNNTLVYYGIEIKNGFILTEELYKSSPTKSEQKLIYERKTEKNGKTNLTFFNEFEHDEKSQVLKEVLLEDFVEPNKPILKLLAKRENKYLFDTKLSYSLFDDLIQFVFPDYHYYGFTNKFIFDTNFKNFTEKLLLNLNLGIQSLKVNSININDYFGEDQYKLKNRIINEIENSPYNIYQEGKNLKEEILVIKENNNYIVQQLTFEHLGNSNTCEDFNINQESDGTFRMLDFIPALYEIIKTNKVYIIDEMERSIHPILLIELVKKFSQHNNTQGQLIFTTHESNLLNLEYFRQDEIWFTEKDKKGNTDIYPLSDFKEHHTKNIKQGYFNGRYGAIPFLGNFKDLNWDKYAISE